MIKPSALMPGRVLTVKHDCWFTDDNGKYVEHPACEVWMIISVEEVVRRRHSKKTAPKEGYRVMMTRIGNATKQPGAISHVDGRFIETFIISPSTFQLWKNLF